MRFILNSPGYDRLKFLTRGWLKMAAPPEDFIDDALGKKRDPYYHGLALWAKCQEYAFAELETKSFFLERMFPIPRARIAKAVMMCMDSRCRPTFSFAHLVRTHHEGPHEFILVAPGFARRAFEKSGFKIHPLSRVLWSLELCTIATAGFKKLLFRIGSATKEIVTLTFKKPATIPRIDTLILGIGPGELHGGEGRADFIGYLESHPKPTPLADGLNVYIAMDTEPKNPIPADSRGVVCRNPFQYAYFSRAPRAALVRELARYILQLLTYPLALRSHEAMIAPQISELPKVSEWVKAAKPKHIAFTNSFFNSQPLWATLASALGVTSWMVFYSAPFFTTAYKDQSPDVACEPIDKYWLFDKYAVWNEEVKQYLVRLGHKPETIEICGPIVFASAVAKREPDPVPTIAVFDLLPVNMRVILPWLGFGIYHNYFPNMKKMLLDIHAAATAIAGPGNFKLVLKSKRSPNNVHDQRYGKFLTEEFSKLAEVEMNDPSTNPRVLIARSRLSLSAPFTSTAYIADSMGVASAWYDVSGMLNDLVRCGPEPQFVSGFEELKAWMKKSGAFTKQTLNPTPRALT